MSKITLLGYLKSSHLDKEGAKTLSFEFSAKQTIEIAKLEIMARDLKNHLPKLLSLKIEVAKNGKKEGGTSHKDKYDFT